MGGLAPGTLAGVGQAVLAGQTPGHGSRGLVTPASPHAHAPPDAWAQSGSLAAERGTLLLALQGTPPPAPPAACCIPFAADALVPLTEGVLGEVGQRVRAQCSPTPSSPQCLPFTVQPLNIFPTAAGLGTFPLSCAHVCSACVAPNLLCAEAPRVRQRPHSLPTSVTDNQEPSQDPAGAKENTLWRFLLSCKVGWGGNQKALSELSRE